MKAGEVRDLSVDEMHQKVTDLEEELFNLKFQLEIGQLENVQKLKKTKREIARVKTIIREKQLEPESREE
jgi:large subunit ribosomal protein L29